MFYQVQKKLLIVDKVWITILSKYLNFVNAFPLGFAAQLFKYTETNNNLINLVINQ